MSCGSILGQLSTTVFFKINFPYVASSHLTTQNSLPGICFAKGLQANIIILQANKREKQNGTEKSSGGVYQGKKSIWRGVSGDEEEDGMAV